MSPNTFEPESDENEDQPQLFVGYNRDQSIVVTYSHYGFVGLQLTEAARRRSEDALAGAIVQVANLAHQKAMADLRERQLSWGASRQLLDQRGLPTAADVAGLQRRIDKDPDV